ncbi:Bug family tripartite tricarboxylate transporter substrate binding protein [Propylenella binzhouense]|uniref:Tripartite tricarboxylate transporter substrate binding protein n=1 Tax=Propylenella binzhouense TaxID=2555902 RepID=A0A964WUI8_9HYPH|nr:tripartite tricarboxylate transporter substrate binding protein [Propylenella binzhouense]MYZ49116.1 tripartite tricarboxylate transporter substrate binding protein [Propylenella binzhouense]
MKSSLTAVLAAAGILLSGAAFAQDAWPTKPITIIVPYAPGGYTDGVTRITAKYLEGKLGHAVVVDNRGGAGGILGTEITADAAPDGYTFCMCSSGAVSIAPVAQKVGYDPLKDFAPVSIVSTTPQVVIANPSVPVSNMAELVQYGKDHPGELNYGSSGIGGLMNYSVELFQSMTGAKFVHVPFKGGAPATAAVVAGEVQLSFTNMSDAIPQIEAKTVKGLAVTSKERSEYLPDLPPAADVAPGFEAISWNGVMAPAGTPQPIVDKLAGTLAEMAKDADVKAGMAKMGATLVATTPDEFKARIAGEVETWTGVLKEIEAKK